MVHHIVMWELRGDLSEAEKKEAGRLIKEKLEAVRTQVAGVISLEVIRESLSSSNRDLGLISVFETKEALDAYQNHPAHLEAASYVRSVTENRACLDYE